MSSSRTPPMRSAAFSRSASQRAASLEAPCTDSTYTEAPVTLRSAIESACTETNMSACATRARRMRSRSSRNSSRSRVSTARMPGSALMRSASARAIASVTSFSRVPPGRWRPDPARRGRHRPRSRRRGRHRPGRGAAVMVCGTATARRATVGCRERPSDRAEVHQQLPPAPGAPAPAQAAPSARSTMRSVPPGWVPKRTPVTTPAPAGARRPRSAMGVAQVDDDPVGVVEA